MTTKLTNTSNISLPIAVWLASDDYDLDFDPNTFSATDFLKPLRSLILTRRLKAKQSQGTVDIADLVRSRVGSAVHSAVEQAWLKNYQYAMKRLGYPEHVINLVRLNPDKETDPNLIYIYMEQRASRELDGIKVSGKYDIVMQGRLKDTKTTKVYSWIMGTNEPRYIWQGSIYRWLNPGIIKDDWMDIEYIFTDWNPLQANIAAQSSKEYPPAQVLTKKLQLQTIPATENFLRDKIQEIKHCLTKPQEDLPECTPEELWMNPPKWAFYKNPKVTGRSTKNFDTEAEALAANAAIGNTGLIVKRIAEPTFCKYCDARAVCTQAARYIAEGILTV